MSALHSLRWSFAARAVDHAGGCFSKRCGNAPFRSRASAANCKVLPSCHTAARTTSRSAQSFRATHRSFIPICPTTAKTRCWSRRTAGGASRRLAPSSPKHSVEPLCLLAKRRTGASCAQDLRQRIIVLQLSMAVLGITGTCAKPHLSLSGQRLACVPKSVGASVNRLG
jgi:hypothetical protein